MGARSGVRGSHSAVITVLYVDDESAGSDEAVAALTANDGFEVDHIDHAAAAIDALDSATYDCVVSGYDLTQLDGLTFLRELRDRWPDLPFVLYTDSGSERVASEAFSAGATDYVEKAQTRDDPDALADALRGAVGGHPETDDEGDRVDDLFDVLPDPALRLAFADGDAVIRGVNPAFEETFGFPADTLTGRSAGVLQVPNSANDGGPESIASTAEQDAPVTRLTTDGPRSFRYRTVPVTTADGTPGMYVIYTATQRASDGIPGHDQSGEDSSDDGIDGDGAASDEEREPPTDDGEVDADAVTHGRGLDRADVDAALEQAATAPWLWDPAEETLSCHTAVGRLFGLDSETTVETLDDLLGRVHPVDRDRVAAAFEDARDDGHLGVDFRLQTDDGEQRWIACCGETVATGGDEVVLTGVFLDVTERKRGEDELRCYQRIVEASSDPVYVLDEEGTFQFVDDAFLAATGFDREEVLGKHVSWLLSEEEVKHGEEIISALHHSDIERGVFECRIQTAYETNRWCEINIALLEDADGEIDGTVGIVRDVTDRKERERELERQTERLEEFASVVAHDLRNPLTVAIGHTEVLQDEYDDEFIDRIADAHERMERLIDDLLALAREGRIVDEVESVDIERVAEDAWATAATAGAELRVEADTTVDADSDRLRTLFENLFRNAVEHGSTDSQNAEGSGDAAGDGSTDGQHSSSADGDVTVTVGDLDGEERGFYVADDGPGIPDADRETIFERGYSTDAGGTGFGLAIVREIADAHGWSISVTESAEGGARFEVTGLEPR